MRVPTTTRLDPRLLILAKLIVRVKVSAASCAMLSALNINEIGTKSIVSRVTIPPVVNSWISVAPMPIIGQNNDV